MLELVYKDSKNNLFMINIDREKKKLYECSKLTKDKYIETKWNRLFDKGKERIQDKITSKFDDAAFIKCLSYWFLARYNYNLKEVKNGNK